MTITRRAAILGLPLAVTGCSLFDNIFNDNKPKLRGKRESVLGASSGLTVDASTRTVTVPPLVNLAAWPQPGGTPVHAIGNIAVTGFQPAWTAMSVKVAATAPNSPPSRLS